jgi:ribosomal protein S18 acetylase RimI-like enzyme
VSDAQAHEDTAPALVRVGAGELDRLAPLWESMRQSYLAQHGDRLPIYDADASWQRRRAIYLRILDEHDGFVLGLERDGVLVAYAAVEVVATSSVFAWSERAGNVETLVTAEAERSQGLGAQLMEAVRAELRLRGVDEVVLHVVADNERALAFYRRLGFAPYLVMLSDRIPAPLGGEAA